jgi:hypothetical protein
MIENKGKLHIEEFHPFCSFVPDLGFNLVGHKISIGRCGSTGIGNIPVLSGVIHFVDLLPL